MMFLENKYLKVKLSALGAELKSIVTTNNKEILWQGNPDFWAKTSPVLFPIVGGLKNNYYEFNNTKYYLNRHGFAREMMFNSQQTSNQEIMFTLQSNQETLKVYPFDFIFKITYKLINNELHCLYEIENTSIKNNLLFSVGGHPAFNLTDGMHQYELIFNNDTVLNCATLINGLIGTEINKIVLNNNTLPLKHEFFYNDALVLKLLKSNEISLRNLKDQSQLKFVFNDFPYFGIWSAKNANFICLEPWCGVADTTNHNNLLIDKEGIINLKPTEIFNRSWSVIIEQ